MGGIGSSGIAGSPSVDKIYRRGLPGRREDGGKTGEEGGVEPVGSDLGIGGVSYKVGGVVIGAEVSILSLVCVNVSSR